MTHSTTLRDLRACIAADTAHSPATEQLAALDAAIAAVEARPDAQPQTVADEREAFEAWAGVEYRHAEQYDLRDYALGLDAWSARAALAAPQPAAVPATMRDEFPSLYDSLDALDERAVGQPERIAVRRHLSELRFCIQEVVQRLGLARARVADLEAAQSQPSGNAPIERALAELVDKIVPGLDTGDLVADATTASKALATQPSGQAQQVDKSANLQGSAVDKSPVMQSHGQQDAEDAARYRWLRDEADTEKGMMILNVTAWIQPATAHALTFTDGEVLDCAIDAARNAEGHHDV